MAQTHYSPFTVASSQVVGTLTDFTALIKVTDNRLRTIANGGNVANANGYDIRPYSDSGLTSALSFELIKYVAATGELIMWVKVPSIATSTTVYLGYGDAALNTNGTSTNAWRSEYAGVWHGGDGSTISYADSTSNGNTLSAGGSGNSAAAGQINGAMQFNGSGWATAGDPASLDIVNEITISQWVKSLSSANSFSLCKQDGGSGNGYEFLIGGGAVIGNFNIRVIAAGVAAEATPLGGMNDGNWHLIYGVVNDTANDITNYRDGTAPVSGTGMTPGTMASTAEFQLGARAGGNRLTGIIEESRVYAGVLSGNWISAEYKNQSAPTTFWPIGTEVATGGGGGGGASPVGGLFNSRIFNSPIFNSRLFG